VITARITPPAATYGDVARADALLGGITERLAALPGVENVALVNGLPLSRPANGVALRVEGKFEDARQRLPWSNHLQIVTPSYFNLLGIPLRRGRVFDGGDTHASMPVVIVSEDITRALWPGQDPIGKRIGYPYESPWMTVVGVVADVKVDNMRDTTVSAIYVPFLQRPVDRAGRARTDFTIVLKTASDNLPIAPRIREVVTSADRGIPISDVQTMTQVVSGAVGDARFTARLVSAFALVALFLGAIGIYGVMSYLVGQRAQELSVRAALGATANELQGLVLRRAVLLAIAGAAVGIALALVATRSLRSLLYGISRFDPVTFTTVPLLFLVVAVAASLGPARRASRSSPSSVLRMD
jgi:predicted permease